MRTELVTTLKRKATEILSELENEKAPILITQYGKPAAYVVDVETYDDLQRQLEILRGIARATTPRPLAVSSKRSLNMSNNWNSTPKADPSPPSSVALDTDTLSRLPAGSFIVLTASAFGFST
jgi:prevent-host-death family protein